MTRPAIEVSREVLHLGQVILFLLLFLIHQYAIAGYPLKHMSLSSCLKYEEPVPAFSRLVERMGLQGI